MFSKLHFLIPLLLIRFNIKLNLSLDENAEKRILMNPLIEPLLVDADTLIKLKTNNFSDADCDIWESMKRSSNGVLTDMLQFLSENMGD